MNKKIALFIFILTVLFSCSKGDDFLATESYPLNWKMVDTFTLIGNSINDTITNLTGFSYIPFGVANDANFGITRTGFYAQYQTTSTSKTFSFASVDSIFLIIPYVFSYGKCNQPINLSIYELTQSIDPTIISTKIAYTYNSTPLVSIDNYIPNLIDSSWDGSNVSGPALRVQLSNDLAHRIIAPGSYADDISFQSVFRGIYLKSNSTSASNGFVYLDMTTNNRIVIYGKDNTGTSISSTFVTGGSSSPFVVDYNNDSTSIAYKTSLTPNPAGDDNIYINGLYGLHGLLKLPKLNDFAKDKNIFKAELVLNNIDVGYKASTTLGLLNIDSATSTLSPILDEYYGKNFRVQSIDTASTATSGTYIFNIGMYLNKLLTSTSTNYINLYSTPTLSGTTITSSNIIPARVVIGGKGANKPKLRIYYTNK